MELQDFIKSSLTEASKIALDKFGEVKGVSKGADNNQVLTEADLAIGKFLVGEIKKFYPKHNVIDEEAGVIDNKSDYTWVIDPVDGTSNFASGSPIFGIILGLLYKDQPLAGGVSLPFFSEIYTAEKGKGAFCNGEKLQVTKEPELLKTLIGYGIDGHQEDPRLTQEECALLAEIILNIRNLRSSGCVFDGMMVAKGKYGGYHHRNTNVWDVVGMQIILEEAGGVFTDFFGNPIDYSNHLQRFDEHYPFCTAPPQLHKKLQEIIQRHKIS